jgi:hypothetical protein
MQEPLAELAAYSGPWYQVPDADLVRLTVAARATGHRWDAIEVACDNGPGKDIPAVIRQQYWFTPLAGPGLFGATQRAARNLTGRDAGCYPPLTWPCPGCGQQITDLAACGRPIHAELGHVAGCARLARDQATDEALRRDWLPRLILYSEDPVGSVQRHWLAGPITDDCPRCGWHGYFHRHLVTVDGDWTRAVCDDCYADLNAGITVTVKFFSARSAGSGEPFAVIRQRTRSDHDYPGIGHFPDRGQQMTWQLCWEHTSMLVEEAHGGADADIAEISRAEAEQIMAELAARHWPPEAARLPWVASAYPAMTPDSTSRSRPERAAGTGRPA